MRVQLSRIALPSYSGNPPIYKKERYIINASVQKDKWFSGTLRAFPNSEK
jgi:hypothetical protein